MHATAVGRSFRPRPSARDAFVLQPNQSLRSPRKEWVECTASRSQRVFQGECNGSVQIQAMPDTSGEGEAAIRHVSMERSNILTRDAWLALAPSIWLLV